MLRLEDIMMIEGSTYTEESLARVQAALDDMSAFFVWNPYNNHLFLRNLGVLVKQGLLKSEELSALNREDGGGN